MVEVWYNYMGFRFKDREGLSHKEIEQRVEELNK